MHEGLLHLGSMAVLVGVVYLNLDKIGSARSAFAEGLRQLREEIRLRFVRADVEISYIYEGRLRITARYDNRHAHFLLCVGRSPDRFEYGVPIRCCYWFDRNWKAPGLHMIADGRDRPAVGILTLLSALALFNQVGAETFRTYFLLMTPPEVPAPALFALYVATITFMIACAIMAHRLDELEPLCQSYLTEMDLTKEHEDQAALRGTHDDLRGFSQGND